MILIADSGSTKTDWRLIKDDNTIAQARCAGFNPYYQTSEEIEAEVSRILKPQLEATPQTIFFYGAGCSSEKKNSIVRTALSHVFPQAHIIVDHDLLAAARALCGSAPGIACILGTGSNSCLYDGKDVIDNKASLGYVLGDEGSGASIGKMIVKAYLDKLLPEDLMQSFHKRFPANREELLSPVYKDAMPNRYLSRFSKFCFDHMKHPFIYRMLYEEFDRFITLNVERYKDYQKLPVHFVGSIGFYYANIIRQIAQDKGILVQNILETPIAGLTLYHQQNQ